MKSFFLSVKFKKVFALFLAIIICLTCLLLSGCGEEDFQSPENPTQQQTFFEKYIGGFNTVFANDLTGSGGIIDDQNKIEETIDATTFGILYFYGNGKEPTNEELTGIIGFNNNAPFPDSIRMLVTAENGNENLSPIANTDKHWNWFIDPNSSPTLGMLIVALNDAENYTAWIEIAKQLLATSYSFPQFMQDIFQVVLYEIMLGIEPTEIEISYENVSNYQYKDGEEDKTIASGRLYTVKIVSSSTITNIKDNILYRIIYDNDALSAQPIVMLNDYQGENKNKVDATLGELQENYLSNSRYIGLTKENSDKLISYILNEMIGADLVAYDYNTYRNQPVNYRNYVATIANLIYIQTYDGSGDDWEYVFIGSGGQEISFVFEGFNTTSGVKPEGSFTAKPATFVRYYPGETFFEPYEVEYAFANVPVGEYQSILVVPAESNETAIDNGLKLESGFIFNFMSKNKDLKINTKIRYQYYNEETGYRKLFEFDCDQVNFENREQKIAPDGSIYYENDFEFAINPEKDLPPEITNEESGSYKTITYTVGFFKNKKLLDNIANETEVSLSNPSVSEIQDLYKVIPSKNGFGGITVLNEKKINSSFFEIVLDVVKSPTDPKNTDYNFALILVPIFGIL